MHFHHHSSQHRTGRTGARFSSTTTTVLKLSLAVAAVVVILIFVTVKNHQNLTSNLSSSSERKRAAASSPASEDTSIVSPDNDENVHHHLHHQHESENNAKNGEGRDWSNLFHKKLRTVHKISIPSQYAFSVTLSDKEQHHHKGSLLNINKERVVLFDTDGDDLIHRVVHPSTNKDASVQDTNYYASLFPFT